MHPLTYIERTPREPSEGTAPVIFLLHGRAAYAKTIFAIEGLLDPRLHVIAVQAPFQSELGGFEWFVPKKKETPEAEHDYRAEESEALLTSTIQSLLQVKPIDPDFLYLLGFSQGAAMTFVISLRGEIEVRGAIPMGGFLPEQIKKWEHLSKHTKFYLAHGDHDEMVPMQKSIDSNEFLISRNIQSEFHEYRGRHKMSLSSLRDADAWLKRDLENS